MRDVTATGILPPGSSQEDTTALLHAAQALCQQGRIDEARVCLETAWEASKWSSDGQCRAACCRRLADLHRRDGQHDLAARYQQWTVRAELEACGETSVPSLVQLARDAARREDGETAMRLLRAAHRAAAPVEKAEVFAAVGELRSGQGRHASGLRHLRRAARRFRRQGDRMRFAEVFFLIGCTLERLHQHRAAAGHFARAVREQRLLGNEQAARRAAERRDRSSRIVAALRAAAELN